VRVVEGFVQVIDPLFVAATLTEIEVPVTDFTIIFDSPI
jgi:hypothetical protein